MLRGNPAHKGLVGKFKVIGHLDPGVAHQNLHQPRYVNSRTQRLDMVEPGRIADRIKRPPFRDGNVNGASFFIAGNKLGQHGKVAAYRLGRRPDSLVDILGHWIFFVNNYREVGVVNGNIIYLGGGPRQNGFVPVRIGAKGNIVGTGNADGHQ